MITVMAMEHVWVQLEDGSRVRGDQVVGFCVRELGEGVLNRNPMYCIEVFGSSASDRFRAVHETGDYPQDKGFLAQLYAAAGTASEGRPRLLSAHEDGGNLWWQITDLEM